MESQSINDHFIDSLEYYDIDIDYSFLNEVLNSETQENDDEYNKFDALNYFDITELDDLNVDKQRLVIIDGNHQNNSNNNNNNCNNNNNKREGWVKRRKFKRGTVEHALWKQEMKLKNRISARRSIEKKEAYTRELVKNIQRLRAENEFKRRVLEIFPNSRPAGRLCGLRRAFSTSDFYVANNQGAAEEGRCTDL